MILFPGAFHGRGWWRGNLEILERNRLEFLDYFYYCDRYWFYGRRRLGSLYRALGLATDDR